MKPARDAERVDVAGRTIRRRAPAGGRGRAWMLVDDGLRGDPHAATGGGDREPVVDLAALLCRGARVRGPPIRIGRTQLGAAIGSLAFTVLGPVGVVAVRQCVAAAVLLAVSSPRLRSLTRRQWVPVLLAAVLGVVNLPLYTAIDRIGLGLAGLPRHGARAARRCHFLSYAPLPLNPLMHELTYARRGTGALLRRGLPLAAGIRRNPAGSLLW